MTRAEVLAEVAGALVDADREHPLRVGVDGVCGAGKTTFANELVATIGRLGRPVVRIDSDGFHHRRERRRRNTADPGRGYYEDAYDFDVLVEQVLVPLGPGGDRHYAVRVHDLDSDHVITDEHATAPPDAIAVFDCTFLQRGGLRTHWDKVIYLAVDLEVACERGVRRDSAALGGDQSARAAYDARYLAACRIYLGEEDPAGRADVVVAHDDPAHPSLAWRSTR